MSHNVLVGWCWGTMLEVQVSRMEPGAVRHLQEDTVAVK